MLWTGTCCWGARAEWPPGEAAVPWHCQRLRLPRNRPEATPSPQSSARGPTISTLTKVQSQLSKIS